jgi:NAD(P)-dependent dehydrogenase (short-subunit alcohol dehydrogenase family)
VTSYPKLAGIFDNVLQTLGSVDFVFANAGIVERDSFYDQFPSGAPPPEPNQLVVDINLKSVINTTYLAQHYFRKSSHKGKGAILVMTASSGGIVSDINDD